jgi:hypothetical protein
MNTFSRLLILGFCIGLSSCASMERDWILSNCSKDGAYAQGMNDGRDGKRMSIEPINQTCPIERVPEALQSYREGYQAGMQANQQSNQEPAQGANYGTVINLGGPTSPDPAYRKLWYCDVEAFGDHFEAFGPTELETRQKATRACTQKNNKMHCEDAACRRNK